MPYHISCLVALWQSVDASFLLRCVTQQHMKMFLCLSLSHPQFLISIALRMMNQRAMQIYTLLAHRYNWQCEVRGGRERDRACAVCKSIKLRHNRCILQLPSYKMQIQRRHGAQGRAVETVDTMMRLPSSLPALSHSPLSWHYVMWVCWCCSWQSFDMISHNNALVCTVCVCGCVCVSVACVFARVFIADYKQ